jgi:hypothetical protein
MPASITPDMNAQNQQNRKPEEKKRGFFDKLKSIFH